MLTEKMRAITFSELLQLVGFELFRVISSNRRTSAHCVNRLDARDMMSSVQENTPGQVLRVAITMLEVFVNATSKLCV